MSGYFSRIARQGGARISGNGERSGRPAKGRPDGHLLPIDLEETVMLSSDARVDSPSAQVDSPVTKPVAKIMDAAVSKGPRTRRSAERVTPPATDSTTENDSSDVVRHIPTEHVSDEVRLIEPDAPRSSKIASESPSLGPSDSPRDTVKPIVAESPLVKAIPADRKATESIKSEPVEKKFFEKTTELIEGQPSEPSEVHTVILREVQEWIAAGQAVTDETIADIPPPTEQLQPRLEEPRTTSERQPGVVRIVDGRRKENAPDRFQEPEALTSINEQNFELSIGSISVVVEGNDKLPPPAPAIVAPQPGGRETPRRTSRLSRHYL